MSVKWTNSYDLNTSKNKHFKIFVSETEDGLIYASCLWYEGDRALKAPGQVGGGLKFDLKTVLGSSEEFVWMDQDESVGTDPIILMKRLGASKENRRLIETWPPTAADAKREEAFKKKGTTKKKTPTRKTRSRQAPK